MKTTNDLRPFRALLIALLALGCTLKPPSTGGAGQPCSYSGDFFNGTFGCEAGLLCLWSTMRCVRPHSQPAGGPCSAVSGGSNDACVEGLICAVRDGGDNVQTCGGPLGLGAVCGGPNDCASGLACYLMPCDVNVKNIPAPVCRVSDASNPCGNPQDAGDAMVGDGAGPDVDSGADF
jgi:hypothetical protein